MVVGALTAYVFCYIAWLVLGRTDQDTRTLVSDLAVLPVGLTSVLLALRASWQPRLDRAARRAWGRLAIGFSAFALGDLAWCLVENVFDLDPFPSAADVGYLAFYPLVLWGLLTFPMALHTRNDRVKFWLDALIVVVGAGAAIWYFVFLSVLRQTHDGPLVIAFAVGYPVGDLLLLLGLATVLLRRPGAGTAGALRVLAAGLTLMVVSDIAFGPLALQDAYQGGGWVDITWILAGLLLGVAGQVQTWRAQQQDATEVGREVGNRPFTPLPYLAVAIGQGLLVVAVLGEWDHTLSGLIVASILVTALVVARQIVAVRENARLLAEQATRRDALLQLAHRFSSQSMPGSLHAEVLRAAVDLVGGENAEIRLWDRDDRQLSAPQRLHDRTAPTMQAALEHACRQAAQTCDTVLVVGAAEHFVPSSTTPLGPVPAVLAVPIMYDSHLFGVLAVGDARPHAHFSADDAEILALLAGIAAASTLGGERARLEGALLAARTAEHELNNQLAIAAGYAELLTVDEQLPAHLRDVARESLAGALEAARLVNEIRQLRRVVLTNGSAPEANVIDLRHSAA
jgi:GAF domain-containing protein